MPFGDAERALFTLVSSNESQLKAPSDLVSAMELSLDEEPVRLPDLGLLDDLPGVLSLSKGFPDASVDRSLESRGQVESPEGPGKVERTECNLTRCSEFSRK